MSFETKLSCIWNSGRVSVKLSSSIDAVKSYEHPRGLSQIKTSREDMEVLLLATQKINFLAQNVKKCLGEKDWIHPIKN